MSKVVVEVSNDGKNWARFYESVTGLPNDAEFWTLLSMYKYARCLWRW